MEQIKWEDSSLVGIKLLDHQHRKLVKLIHLLGETMAMTTAQDLVPAVLLGLMTYVRSHYRAAEVFVNDVNDRRKAPYQEEYHRLLRQLAVAVGQFEKGHPHAPEEILRIFRNWLTEHLRRCGQTNNRAP